MVPSEKEITAQEFEKRLVALCRGTNSGLPRSLSGIRGLQPRINNLQTRDGS